MSICHADMVVTELQAEEPTCTKAYTGVLRQLSIVEYGVY